MPEIKKNSRYTVVDTVPVPANQTTCVKKGLPMSGQERAELRAGLTVSIVLKKDQRTGVLTKGVIQDLLTKSPRHSHGIKVRLESGEIGRVKEIHTDAI